MQSKRKRVTLTCPPLRFTLPSSTLCVRACTCTDAQSFYYNATNHFILHMHTYRVWYFSGNDAMKSWICAILAASTTSASVTGRSTPLAMFSRIVPWNRTGSCCCSGCVVF